MLFWKGLRILPWHQCTCMYDQIKSFITWCTNFINQDYSENTTSRPHLTLLIKFCSVMKLNIRSQSQDTEVSVLVDQWLSVLVDQWLSVLVDQWLSVLVDQWLSVLGDQWLSVLVDQWLSVLGDQWLSISVSFNCLHCNVKSCRPCAIYVLPYNLCSAMQSMFWPKFITYVHYSA